jgi:hypothetical protein
LTLRVDRLMRSPWSHISNSGGDSRNGASGRDGFGDASTDDTATDGAVAVAEPDHGHAGEQPGADEPTVTEPADTSSG